MSTCAILGGGISGLATAYYLAKLGGSSVKKIILLESSNRVGGWVKSVKYENGLLFEQGPRSIRGVGKAGYNTLELVEDLKMENDIIPIPRDHVAAKNRFIYVNQKLCKLPSSLKAMLTTQPPFTKPLFFYGLMEPFKKKSSTDDETVDSFFTRRFGSEIANYAANPMCRGIFAGDSKQLSMRSCFPIFHEFDAKYGSIIKATLLRPRPKRSKSSNLVDRFAKEKWTMWSLKEGLEQLPTKLHTTLTQFNNVEVKLSSKVTGIHFQDGQKIKLQVDLKEEIPVDHLFSSLPSYTLSTLLQPTNQNLSTILTDIRFATVGVVNFIFPNHVKTPYLGFGHLVPSFENTPVLGVLYEGYTFPQHNGRDNKMRITVMVGGAWFEDYFGDPNTADKSKIEEMSIKALRDQLFIKEKPELIVTNLQKRCIPQYKVGHHEALLRAESIISKNNLALSLVGCSYRGVSINDCIYNAKLAVSKYLGVECDD